MKKIFYLTIAVLLSSCSKSMKEAEHLNELIEEENVFTNGFDNTLYPIGLNSSGNYTSSYNVGLNFGNSFIYPSSVPLGGQGQPYAAAIDVIIVPNIKSQRIAGAHFNIQLGPPLFVPDMEYYNALNLYNSHFDEYIANTRSAEPNFSSYYSGATITNITGTFVYDASSSTNVSVRTLMRGLLLIETVPDYIFEIE